MFEAYAAEGFDRVVHWLPSAGRGPVERAFDAYESAIARVHRRVSFATAGASGILPIMMIGVGLDARLGLPFEQLRAVAREAARLGFESLWTPAGGVPDSFHVCSAWAQDTSLRTGISVVPAARMWTRAGPRRPRRRRWPSCRTGGSCSASAPAATDRSSGRRSACPTGRSRSCASTSPRSAGCWPGEQVAAGPIIARAGVGSGAPGWPQSASLGLGALPAAPVALAALGPQMLRLAGEISDGALLNWATPERIAVSRELVDAGSARAGRDPGSVPLTMYIRVCIDDDVAAARRAFGTQVLGYAMGHPGIPQNEGYRGLFSQMGFDAELTELEARRDRGAPMTELVDAAPDHMLRAVGYYGPAGAGRGRVRPAERRARRGHRQDHHRAVGPRAGHRGDGRADAGPDRRALAAGRGELSWTSGRDRSIKRV